MPQGFSVMVAEHAERARGFGARLLAKSTDIDSLLAGEQSRPFCAIYLNFHSYGDLRGMESQLSAVSVVTFDGAAMPWLLRFLRVPVRALYRQSFDFSGIADRVFAAAVANGWKVLLIGGREDEVQAARGIITSRHAGLQVVGALSGFHSFETLEKRCQEVTPDLIIIGLGHLLQERFAARVFRHARIGAMTCGAFISQTAVAGRRGDYYPAIVRRFGGRWVYRVLREPRIVKRLFFDYPRGFFLLARDVLWSGQ